MVLSDDAGTAASSQPGTLKGKLRQSAELWNEERVNATDFQEEHTRMASSVAKPNGNIVREVQKANGTLSNGTARPSGEMTDVTAGATALEPLGEGQSRTSPEHRTRTGEAPLVNGRPVTRDEGEFASASVTNGQEQSRWPSNTTKVALTASSQDRKSGDAPVEPTQSGSSEKSPKGFAALAGALHMPHSHRASSPPAFNRAIASPSASPTAASPMQQTPRLQQRHTLEVPRVSTASRVSKESTNQEENASVTGRFSPNTPTRRRASISLVRRATRSIQSDLHLDDVPPDEDAVRWAEYIRQKRASKRKRKDDEDDDRVVVGTKVDQNHVNWVTAYNMLTGIRFTVSRTNAKMDRPLTDGDFDARHKFSFDVTGNELTPSAKYDFKFKDYAPWVFRRLRANFKLDPADYLMSLTSKYILSELGSPGKSGSFFYFSRDYKYIIKTIHHAEHKFLRKVLRDYYNHVTENPNTLLSQFYGLHRVKIPYGRKIHFVVMNNLFPAHRDIHTTFDLKGSTIGRDFKEDDLESNPRATLKDLNWLRRNLHLEFGPAKKKVFVEQMERDVALLRRLKIMDYSLLVGIHDLERGNEEGLRDKNLKVFQPGGEDEKGGPDPMQANALARTPSKLESARRAKELRGNLKSSRPIPMEQASSKMPEEWEWKGEEERKSFHFYADDGGFRATHEDNSPGEEIYYLGIIDCLTYYGLIKRIEHFWKGLSNPESQISAVPPDRYGDRFVKFINGVAKTREAAELEKAEERERTTREPTTASTDRRPSGLQMHPISSQSQGHPPEQEETDAVMERAERQAEKSKRQGADESAVPSKKLTSARSPSAERGGDTGGGYTLPVVEEDVEGGSTGGRSGRSLRSAEHSPDGHASNDKGTAPPPPRQTNGAHDSQQDSQSPTPPTHADAEAATTRPDARRADKRASNLNKSLPPPPTEARPTS